MIPVNQPPENNPGPAFHVGPIPVYGDLILSPMDGFSDLPFRSLARSLGSAMSYTEFVNAIDVTGGTGRFEQRLRYLPEERPVVFQLFDDDPERLVRAAENVMRWNPDIIDINMGCSAKNVSGRGAGAGLLRTPEKISQFFSTLSKSLPVPVTGKIRLGWDDDHLNYLEVARRIEDSGGQLVAIHGRTRQQGYTGQARWAPIREIKECLTIPVIANGDVKSVADIQVIKQQSGCDGVMIGRAAIGNPWIFARMDHEQVPVDEVRRLVRHHLRMMLDFYGEEEGLVLFRKHAVRYVSPYPLSREDRSALLTCTTPEAFLDRLDQILAAPLLAPDGHNGRGSQHQQGNPDAVEEDEPLYACSQ